jgi:hypothetical protein
MSKLVETEKREKGEGQSQEHAVVFFDVKWIVHKEFVLAGQTVNSAYSCDIIRRLRKDFAPKFSDKKTGYYVTTTHRPTIFFSPGNF